MIEDDEYVAPPVEASSETCGCAVPPTPEDSSETENEGWGESAKENEVPIPVPSPGVLRDLQVRRSVRTFKLAGSKPYLLVPACFPGVSGSKRPVMRRRRSTYMRAHLVRKIAPSNR